MQKVARKLLVGGNWKCNNSVQESKKLVTESLNNLMFNKEKVEVVIAPMNLHITNVQQWLT